MKTILLTIAIMIWAITGFTQNGRQIALQVVNEKGGALEGVTVTLLKADDSGLLKAGVTDKDGSVVFEPKVPGRYRIHASMTGYAAQDSKTIEAGSGSDAVRLQLQLQPLAPAALENVTVSAKKPFIQKLNDRIVVNVESSPINAGSSAFEILERSPGITIDQNDVLSLRGRQGVIIMIDGKPTPMSGQDLANYLRGLPANAIDRIDIITNPSSKYDASGNSGIIDIRMKKDQRMGANGTLTAGYGQGIYPKANAGGSFNYRDKKINIFGNYNLAHREILNNLLLNRNFFTNGVFNGADNKNNYSTATINSHTARLGADFFPSKNTIIGVVVNGNYNSFARDNRNNSTVINDQYEETYRFNTNGNNNDHFHNIVGNLNFKHSFNNAGKELTADVDYGEYHSSSLSTTATRYYALDGSKLQQDYVLTGDQGGVLKLKTAKADYVQPFSKGLRLEAGAKSSDVSSDNDAKFFDMSSGTPVTDASKTNHFLYQEINHAGYINLNKDYKKFNVQFGLRGEYTKVKTHQMIGDVHWDSSYFQLFPSAFINYKLKEDQTLGLSVSRRINRPGYNQLNPFLFLIDVTTYATGNPALLPELTWSYELSYTLKQLNFSVNYSHTRDNHYIAIARFKDVFPNIPMSNSDNVTVQIPVNLISYNYLGLTVSAPVHISKWWNMVNNMDVYYNRFNGNLGNNPLNVGSAAADFRADNSFALKKGWSAELNGSYRTNGRNGYMVGRPQWSLAAGVQRTVFKTKGTIRLNITDIFWTDLPKATITYPGSYIENWHAYRDSRVANLSFTYRFGNSKVAAARRRTTGSEEERRRAGN